MGRLHLVAILFLRRNRFFIRKEAITFNALSGSYRCPITLAAIRATVQYLILFALDIKVEFLFEIIQVLGGGF